MVQQFDFHELELSGAYLIQPFIATDNRGKFIKDYSKEVFEDNGIFHELKEVFYTYSKKGVIRAIHFQREREQAKLVRCIKGKIYDVIVDLRKESKTYGKWKGIYLSDISQQEIYIPEHFGHGYLVLEEAIVSYKCAEKFYAKFDDGIIWNDEDLKIKWPLELVDDQIILSEKDKNLQSFSEYNLKDS